MDRRLIWMVLLTGFLSFNVSSQQNLSLLNQFFQDRYFIHSSSMGVGNSVFPYSESTFDLNRAVADSSRQYYEITEILFKKHLFEVKGENYYLTISPVADLSMGKDLSDTNDRRLFQNTRGFFIEGDLMKNFSFSTAFYENQGRYTSYETDYYRSIGELYPNASSGYNTQNAMIPGSARTKPFNVDGFDYAFATGNIVYRPIRQLTLIAGNTPHFIGDGYRSLLLSDNGVAAPFYRIDYRMNDKFEFVYIREKLQNLMRKPASSSAEAYYEPKAYSVNYLTWKPTGKLAFSLFEGTIWSKGDSIQTYRAHPLFYSPVPVVNALILHDSLQNQVTGLNISFVASVNHRFYGQFAMTDLDGEKIAFQVGYRGMNFFGLKDLMLQLEYNHASKGMYISDYRRLNQVNSNLPMAHPKGNGFQELVFRFNYEYRRIYADVKTVYYLLKDYDALSLLPVVKPTSFVLNSILHQSVEFGYRFNRKMNLSVFAGYVFRSPTSETDRTTSMVQFGMRTAILNRYTDF